MWDARVIPVVLWEMYRSIRTELSLLPKASKQISSGSSSDRYLHSCKEWIFFFFLNKCLNTAKTYETARVAITVISVLT